MTNAQPPPPLPLRRRRTHLSGSLFLGLIRQFAGVPASPGRSRALVWGEGVVVVV